jgi:tetratricopeptide (TPR) repeat protein
VVSAPGHGIASRSSIRTDCQPTQEAYVVNLPERSSNNQQRCPVPVYVRGVMTLAESMRQHDGRWARLGVTVVVSLILLFGLALFARWIKPGELIQGRSVVRACFDAQDLYDARLLREARSAYIAVEKTYGRHRCPPLDRSIEADQMLAAAEREKGAEYLRAAQLRRGARFEHGRRIAQVLARQAFTASLAIDPYQARTRRDLNLLLDELPGPTDRASADLRCLLGSRLRAAGLLPEAVTVYTQALRVARHSKCTAHGLRLTRTDLAQGRQSFVEADALSADGRHDAARHKYLQALAIDSAISEARKALAANPGPDPEDGTLTGRARSTFDAGVAGLGGFVDWLAAHAAALGRAVVAACVALLILMGFLMFLTRAKFVRGGLATWPLRWLPLRRFTHPRVRIAAFTPPEKAGGSEAIFAEYLMMAPILENADGGRA